MKPYSKTRQLFWYLTLFGFYIQGLPIVHAQQITQVIRGTVSDDVSRLPLSGAIVVVMESDPVLGTTTDSEGRFRMEQVPVGRCNLQISYMGYEDLTIDEIVVAAGKETVLSVAMKESPVALDQVVVRAPGTGNQAAHPMAVISSRQLTMEQAARFAGGVDDPARLASSFAGVAGSLSSNAIAIRGNAPKGLLWRMEGVEIPNPSHFANVTTFGGGGITALSAQMLANSDFYTGAFPAEFGNALSGVFDMRMRSGNTDNREHTCKAGLIGIDFSSEGPVNKGGLSSYLFNYRYSTLALIAQLLPENARGIRYSDFSWKLNAPTGKSGTWSVWGMVSGDRSGSVAKTDTTEIKYYQDMEQDKNVNAIFASGLTYQVVCNERNNLAISAAYTGNRIKWDRKRLLEDGNLRPLYEISQVDEKYTWQGWLNHRFGRWHLNRTGFSANILRYNMDIDNQQQAGFEPNQKVSETGNAGLLQLYTQSRMDVHAIRITAGLHAQLFTLARQASIEPRLGIRWRIDDKHAFSLSGGLHSRLEPLFIYFTGGERNGRNKSNTNLLLAKALHLVAGYELAPAFNTRLRIEPYFQYLYDVPVIEDSSFSMINMEMDWFFNQALQNEGKGCNYGLDFTAERILKEGFYYLVTFSLFGSRYAGGDLIWRSSRFNRNYIINILGGKEWSPGNRKQHLLSLNWRVSLLGGDRMSPLDSKASQQRKEPVYNESKAFEERKPPTFYVDMTFSYQRNRPKYSTTFSLQFVNLLFQKEFYGHRYNLKTGNMEAHRETVAIPNISYRIDF